MGSHFLLQGIFPTQGSNPGLPNYRQILDCLSHQVTAGIFCFGTFAPSSNPLWDFSPPFLLATMRTWLAGAVVRVTESAGGIYL